MQLITSASIKRYYCLTSRMSCSHMGESPKRGVHNLYFDLKKLPNLNICGSCKKKIDKFNLVKYYFIDVLWNNCRYAPSVSATREPGYDAPGSVEEIYFRPSATMPRPVSTAGCYYHPHQQQIPMQQPIYEDELMMMSTHYPTMQHTRHRRSSPLYDLHLAGKLWIDHIR